MHLTLAGILFFFFFLFLFGIGKKTVNGSSTVGHQVG